ncbi:CENP-B N-terminal DNA-binding domain [Popillia japonica]|uniref:CENP-B N-terminal DNA-binding domain n=1 Tax=Popillia japonica TaxID=7064 RepID=A0AAW1J077_POPJA
MSTTGMCDEENLKKAIEEEKTQTMSVYRASNVYGIPRKSLERRIKLKKNTKGLMGPSCTLGTENEKKLCQHIKDMQSKGFPLTIDDLRKSL